MEECKDQESQSWSWMTICMVYNLASLEVNKKTKIIASRSASTCTIKLYKKPLHDPRSLISLCALNHQYVTMYQQRTSTYCRSQHVKPQAYPTAICTPVELIPVN